MQRPASYWCSPRRRHQRSLGQFNRLRSSSQVWSLIGRVDRCHGLSVDRTALAATAPIVSCNTLFGNGIGSILYFGMVKVQYGFLTCTYPRWLRLQLR